MSSKTLVRASMAAFVTALMLAMSVSSVALAQDVMTLTSTGAGSITVPAGYEWTNVSIQCWGGGGGGGGGYTSGGGYYSYYGGGGAGGAYSAKTYTTPLIGGAFSYYVGAGGRGSATDSAGSSGGSTVWNYLAAEDIIAGGGGGGSGGSSSAGGGGGTDGTVGAGAGYAGGAGGADACTTVAAAAAPPAPRPGRRRLIWDVERRRRRGRLRLRSRRQRQQRRGHGRQRQLPGGGGGGGAWGGNGANGEIVVTYTPVYCGQIWSASGGGSWTTAANWAAGTIPDGVGNTPDFSQQRLTSNATVTLDGSHTIGYLVFGDQGDAHNWTLAPGAGGTLTLQVASGAPIIAVNNQTTTISAVLAGNQGLSVLGGGRLVLAASNVYTGGTTVASGTLQLGDGATNNGYVQGNIANNAALVFANPAAQTYAGTISGNGSLTKLGNGTLVLRGSNSYSGATVIGGGTLQLGTGQAGQDGAIAATSGVTNNGALAFDLAGSQTVHYAINGSGSLSKLGTGILTLTAPSTYSGPTTIAGGTVNFLGPVTVTGTTISAGGTTNPGSYSLTGNTLSITGAGNDFWGTTQQGYFVYEPVPASQNFDVAVHIASMTTQNTDGWEKAGIMARQDASNNDVSTVFDAETEGNGVSFQWVDQSQNVQAGTSLGPNWLRMTYNAATHAFTGYESPSTSTTAPAASDPSWVAISSYTVSMGTASTFLLGIADTAHNNTDTVTAVFDNLGTMGPLFAPTVVKNYLPAATALSIASGGTLDLSGGSQQVASLSDQTPGSGGSIVNSGTGTSVLSVSPTGGSTTFSGAIQGGGTSGTISLVMSGSGTQVLAGSNTYTGPTTINGGKLVVNGSLASAVTVNSGGTLGGSGHLGNVTVNTAGAIAPGSPLGTMTISGNLSLAAGAMMDFELDSPSDDMLSCGSLAISSPLAFSNFDFTPTANFRPGRLRPDRGRLAPQRRAGQQHQRYDRRLCGEPRRARQ